MIRFAKIISFVFSPPLFFLLMPFFIVYRQTHSGYYALKWQIFTILFLFAAGVLFLIGRLKGTFSDEDVSKREERYRLYILLYSLAFIYFLISLFIKGIFFPLSIVAFGIIIGILVFNFVNYYIKASIHIGVATAFVLTIGFLYGWNYSLLILWITPIVAWARIVTKRHTIRETILGGFLGSIITLLTFFIGKEIYKY